MSIAQTRAARRKLIQRQKEQKLKKANRSVHELVAAHKSKAARAVEALSRRSR